MTTELRQPPTDTISRVIFSPVEDENLLLTSSWDGKVRLYDAASNELKAWQTHSQVVLDCCFLRTSKSCVSGGLAKDVVVYDFEQQQESVLGSHDAAVRCVEFDRGTNTVFSGSWDHMVKGWDPRMKSMTQTCRVPGKVFAMSLANGRLVVCDSMKTVSVFDVRNLNQPEQVKDHVLKYQYRAVRCFPNGTGFALSSIEGRVAWEYFAMEETSNLKKYAFKCHREKDNGVEVVYPVNALAFHPIHGTFATGGSDGGVSVWDGCNKKRLWRLSKNLHSSISSLAFSANGARLAIAISYDFSQGPKDPMPSPQILIRQVKEEDVLPKAPS